MGRYVAAIDQGTTSTRCLVFDREGRCAGHAQVEHRQLFPRPGWVEHDPVEILENTRRVAAGALARAGIPGTDLAAVGITNQRETTVVWDRRTGRPVHNAIVWQDTRTDALCRELAGAAGPDRFRGKTGLPLATYFSGPKLRWLLDAVDGLRDAAGRGDVLFGTVDAWLVWNLTGGPDGGRHATDVTNASRTLLADLETGAWDGGLLDAVGVPRAMLPEILPSSHPDGFGLTAAGGPFGARVPITGVLGDQQAAAVGQSCFSPGDAKNTYGTGCFLLLHTGDRIVRSRHGLLTTPCYRFGDGPTAYALEGSVAVAGAVIQWLRDNLGVLRTAAEIEDLAAGVEDTGGVVFVPAFSGLFAPRWRSDARGAIVGLTRFTDRRHLARAALEAVAYQTREVIEAMAADAGVPLRGLRVDGGMVVNDLLMQLQADVLGAPVTRPRVTETTALGAAFAAGLGVGFWAGTDEISALWSEDRTWQPRSTPDEREQGYRRWNAAVQRSLGWAGA